MQAAKSSKILLIVIILIIIAILSGIFYYSWKLGKNTPSTLVTSGPTAFTASPEFKQSSPFSTTSPIISPTTSPTQSSVNYQIPPGETFEISSKADTNDDGKEETLVVTKMTSGKYHAYVLSYDNTAILFDNKALTQKPLRIATQVYNEGEKYPSWMLVFTEQSGNLAFIHWNGLKYEIPQENLGI